MNIEIVASVNKSSTARSNKAGKAPEHPLPDRNPDHKVMRGNHTGQTYVTEKQQIFTSEPKTTWDQRDL